MPELPKNADLAALQKYVQQLEEERGFTEDGVITKCLLLGEEIGELFKAVRKHQRLNLDKNSKQFMVAEELADILIYICAIANRFDIELEDAFLEKEAINKERSWN